MPRAAARAIPVSNLPSARGDKMRNENRESTFVPKGPRVAVSKATKVAPTTAAKNAITKNAGSEVVRGTLEEQVGTLIEQQFAKVRAMRFARETDSLTAQAQCADGHQRWVIFKDEAPIASFPSVDGEFEEALRFHNLERLRMREPRELAAELEADREARKKRWRIWAGESGSEQEDVVEELLLLEAGSLESD